MYSSILKYFQNIFKRKQKKSHWNTTFCFCQAKNEEKRKKRKKFWKNWGWVLAKIFE